MVGRVGVKLTGMYPRVTVPDSAAPEAVNILLGAVSLGTAVTVGTGAAVVHVARSGVRRLPTVRVRLRWLPVDTPLRALDDRGRLERAGFRDRLSRIGSTVLPAVVRGAMARIDLTALVIEFVDLDAIAAHLDVDQILERLDLAGIASYVVDEIDLPNIVRQSTGSMGTEVAHTVRVQSVDADHLLERTVDRLLLRRNGRRVELDDGRGALDDLDNSR